MNKKEDKAVELSEGTPSGGPAPNQHQPAQALYQQAPGQPPLPKPGQLHTLGILTLIDGILNILWGIGLTIALLTTIVCWPLGIYTIVRQQETGYVSVGFPLPESNFTATLLPYNNGSNFILKTQDTGSEFPGHYLTDIDDEDGSLTILKLPTMGEKIDVYVRDGRLKTDHSFYFGGFKFLTLFYSMERKPEASE